MIRAMIVDDDPSMRMILCKALMKYQDIQVSCDLDNGQAAIDYANGHVLDLALLDVDMPKVNGIEAAKAITELYPKCKVVFITAHQDYMAEAFELYAYDYIMKPFKMDRFHKTIDRILSTTSPMQGSQKEKAAVLSDDLVLKIGQGVVVLKKHDILMVERVNRQTIIVTREDEFAVTKTLQEMEDLLGEDFMRSHKSYIVQTATIKALEVYGRWTYVVKLHGTSRDALMTKEKAALFLEK